LVSTETNEAGDASSFAAKTAVSDSSHSMRRSQSSSPSSASASALALPSSASSSSSPVPQHHLQRPSLPLVRRFRDVLVRSLTRQQQLEADAAQWAQHWDHVQVYIPTILLIPTIIRTVTLSPCRV
jgi:hypothetical protein